MQSCPHTLIFWVGQLKAFQCQCTFRALEGATAWFLSHICKSANKGKEDLGRASTSKPFSSLLNLLGGFTDSDESDSYAGELIGDGGDLFTRVRRFQGSSFPAGAPRRPGFMFPPPPSGPPPPEPGELYSVLQCKEIKSKTKDTKAQIWNSCASKPKGVLM